MMMPSIEFQLHISGAYIENNKKIYIDRVFIISRDLYDRIEIRDIINYD